MVDRIDRLVHARILRRPRRPWQPAPTRSSSSACRAPARPGRADPGQPPPGRRHGRAARHPGHRAPARRKSGKSTPESSPAGRRGVARRSVRNISTGPGSSAPRPPFFIDKLPNNWAHVGLIRLILPNAKIIDARRHPLACGFSNFKQHFARGQEFTYDLAQIGRYYARLCAADAPFRRGPAGLRPSRHPRATGRRSGSRGPRGCSTSCGLPFDPACLRFHENTRAGPHRQLRTGAPADQPRGLGPVEAVRAWLDPLKDALGPALQHWDDAPRP